MRKPATSKLIEAIQKADGNLTQVAEALGCARGSVYRWINGSEGAKQALEDTRESLVDKAVSKLDGLVEDSNPSAVFYVLNNSPHAKRRGWGPRQEVTGADGGAIPIVALQPGTLDKLGGK